MKTFLVIAFLAALGLLAEASVVKQIKPKNIVVPVYPKYTYAEWQDIMAAQKQIPEVHPEFKQGTEPQPDFAGKVYVPDSRITGGNTAERGQFPWQVALVIDDSWFCGGSVISNQWVLTAAHCAGSSYEVRLGANRIDTNENGAHIETSRTSHVHEQWNSNTLNNDIAVIKINAVQLSQYISIIKLPSSNIGDLSGQSVRVSGWGKTSDSASGVSAILKYVDLTVISNTECARTYGSVITNTKVCTSTPGGKSTCSGDSGGPLIHRGSDGGYVQVGIVSFGAAAGCELGYPAAFTRVSSYLSWIQSQTGVRLF